MFAEKIPDPVQWSEGMLLTPQHFQQQHIYMEYLLRHQMEQLQSNYWGLLELDFDSSALMGGIINIKKLRAVMPDGLVVDYDARQQEALTLDLKTAAAIEEDKTVTIQLVIPVRGPGAASQTASIKRFDSIEAEAVVDENTGEGHVFIQRLRVKLNLMANDHPPKRYISLPLFKVEFSREGAYKLTPYLPPLLRLAADGFMGGHSLNAKLKKLVTYIREKAMQLADVSRTGQQQMGQSITRQHEYTVRCLVCELPQLEILLASETAHPGEIYMGLARIMGQISGLSKQLIPPLLPKYEHNNMREGFEKAIKFIRPIIEEINLAYTTIDFNEDKAGVFSINLDKAWVKNTNKLIIELRADKNQSRQQLLDWLSSCRIASKSMLEKLAKHRLMGAKAQPIRQDEELGIVSSTDGVLVNISYDEKLIHPGQPLYIVSTNNRQANNSPRLITYYVPHHITS